MLPNFMIIGAMKSGTTSVYHYLKEHSQVFMPAYKEPEFFSSKAAWERGFEWYESLFAGRKDEPLVGEASTDYSKYPQFKDVPERISKMNKDMKFIYVIREPISRIYSHYVHNYYSGREGRGLEDAVLNDEHYRFVSQYHYQLQQYWNYFPQESVKVVVLDDLRSDPLTVMQDIYAFLGVDKHFIPSNVHQMMHQSKNKQGRDNALMRVAKRLPLYYAVSSRIPEKGKALLNPLLKKTVEKPATMSAETKRKLIELLDEDIVKMSTLLNRDLKSEWYLG